MKYNPDSLIIAVDFDGTIVDHEYPRIGKEKLFAFSTLKKLHEHGHKLILWTYRAGPLLEEAVNYCRDNGVEFYAVNESYPGEELDKKTSRKINADLFIDDRNVGGFVGWDKIWSLVSGEEISETDKVKPVEKKSFWSKLTGK